jgi:hypothetical protein
MPSSSETKYLSGVLAAAFEVFEDLRQTARRWEARDQDLFPAFFMAGSAAADGRDALTTAPAFPAGLEQAAGAAGPSPGLAAAPVADQMAAQAAALAVTLEQAASAAPAGHDRRACAEAASAARRISELLAGPGARNCR